MPYFQKSKKKAKITQKRRQVGEKNQKVKTPKRGGGDRKEKQTSTGVQRPKEKHKHPSSKSKCGPPEEKTTGESGGTCLVKERKCRQ